MARIVSKSFIHTKTQSGPDIVRLTWILLCGLGLLGSSLFVLFMGHA